MQLFTLMLNVFPNVMFQRFIPQYSCDCLFKSWFDALTALPMSCCSLFLETLLSQLVYGLIPTLGCTQGAFGRGGTWGVSKEQGGVPEGGWDPCFTGISRGGGTHGPHMSSKMAKNKDLPESSSPPIRVQ